MKDNGLQDPELQTYHRSLKYTGNFFLSEILESDYFHTVTTGDYIEIYPLFYTDEISSDYKDILIKSPYYLRVPSDFKGLITFKGNDDQVGDSKDFELRDEGDYYTIIIYNAVTYEILPNQAYTIQYAEHDDVTRITGDNGYDTFIPLEEDFEVVL